MAEITCPECGHEATLLAIRRGADEFCPQCDFPLFWAATATPALTRGRTNDDTLRRLPGAGGRRRVGSKICPWCGELNPVGNVHCLRCADELDPREPEPLPPPVVIEAPEPKPIWVPEPAEKPWILWFVWAASAVSVVVLLAR